MSAYEDEAQRAPRDDERRVHGVDDDRVVEQRLDEELLDELLVGGDPEPRRSHDGIPITGYHGGEPIPDLSRIPQERWRAVLAPLSRRTRNAAKGTVRTQSEVSVAMQLVGELLLEDGEAQARAAEAAPPRMPTGAPPARGASRQMNFRLGPDEHARLLAAARLFGVRPTTLARILTVRGVDRALYEERRDR